eukprot:4649119-Pleurochrysis_carterae.AAC.1
MGRVGRAERARSEVNGRRADRAGLGVLLRLDGLRVGVARQLAQVEQLGVGYAAALRHAHAGRRRRAAAPEAEGRDGGGGMHADGYCIDASGTYAPRQGYIPGAPSVLTRAVSAGSRAARASGAFAVGRALGRLLRGAPGCPHCRPAEVVLCNMACGDIECSALGAAVGAAVCADVCAPLCAAICAVLWAASGLRALSSCTRSARAESTSASERRPSACSLLARCIARKRPSSTSEAETRSASESCALEPEVRSLSSDKRRTSLEMKTVCSLESIRPSGGSEEDEERPPEPSACDREAMTLSDGAAQNDARVDACGNASLRRAARWPCNAENSDMQRATEGRDR